ncbi:MAG: hypothetical protein JXA82_15160 [Sedimentisphaerales bacterium]|nr:hypothetical protein [Sedimentisphaerales bacterium]
MTKIEGLRKTYHKTLVENALRYRVKSNIPNIADGHNAPSMDFSERLVKKLGFELKEQEDQLSSQTIGQHFAEATADFIRAALNRLGHLRPGEWTISTSQAFCGITAYDQYEHLAGIQRILNENPELKTALGGDYLITPDIIIARRSESDEKINQKEILVSTGASIVSYAPLRAANIDRSQGILHASVSCKWTIRSDRAQNTRTEALNLIRNRKGNTPHIVAVTFEPLPSRLASLALGTGDLDCMYHAALHELMMSIEESERRDHADHLKELIEGRRLRDISDLPFDLAI